MKPLIAQVEEKIKQVSDLLVGEKPDVIASTLMVVVARFFAAHHPIIREEVINLWLGKLREMTALEVEVLEKQKPWRDK